VIAAAAVLSFGIRAPSDDQDPWLALGHWQLWGEMSRVVMLDHAYGRVTLRIMGKGRDMFVVQTGQRMIPVRIVSRFEDGCHMEVDGRHICIQVFETPHGMTLFLDGKAHDFYLPDLLETGAENLNAEDRLVAPMPGFIKVVRIGVGDSVVKGEALIVMEAMKMETTLSAPRDGFVESVNVAETDQVAEGTVLLTLKPEEAR
jgi:3-methylcrotonyl-CoA carboxylase alpha subunit